MLLMHLYPVRKGTVELRLFDWSYKDDVFYILPGFTGIIFIREYGVPRQKRDTERNHARNRRNSPNFLGPYTLRKSHHKTFVKSLIADLF